MSTRTIKSDYGSADFLEHYSDAWSSNDDALIAAQFSEDGSYVESSYDNTYTGREEIARFVRFMRAFSPDTKVEYISHCGTRENFALEWIWSGTATGKLKVDGVVHPPSNLRYSIPGVAMCRANAAGEVCYHRDYYDLNTLLRQLGIR